LQHHCEDLGHLATVLLGCRHREKLISGKWGGGGGGGGGGGRERRGIGDEDINSNNFPQQTKPLFVLVTATWCGHLEIPIEYYFPLGV